MAPLPPDNSDKIQKLPPRPIRPQEPPMDAEIVDDSPQPPRRRPQQRQDDEVVSTLIPYKNSMALTAYYCGVFGLIPILGFILGPIALIFGIIGLRKVNENPEVKGTGHAITGIILGSLELLAHIGCIAFGVLRAFRF